MSNKRIVLFVDNKKRDLPGAALLAHHLETFGIETHLEPLGAWRAVLAAHKPHMIIFNHLLGSHLVQYSRELARRGILTAVLPNEGILYNKEVLEFNASKFHNQAHIDYFFVWNEAHKQAIEKGNSGSIKHVEIVGVPRFDFYFSPLVPEKTTPSPTILVCTNFVFAQYKDKDPSLADRLFAPWRKRISSYRDYWNLIETNHRARRRFFDFLDALTTSSRNYNIVLKPHPGEEPEIYRRWYERLDSETRKRIRLDTESYIWELIPQCDVEIACETCTTTLESWIAGKPTIELLLEKHPVFYHEFLSEMTLNCDDPLQLERTVEEALTGNNESRFDPLRREHLRRWCDSPNGQSTHKLARIISDALEGVDPDFSGIDLSHRRKGFKLKALRAIDQPYNFNPFTLLRATLLPRRYRETLRIYNKSIRPSEVREWRRNIRKRFQRQ